jgi:hypothetical protein
MKKFRPYFLAIAVVCTVMESSVAQLKLPAASPSATVTQGVGLGEVRIEYSRPSLKGRKMFGAQHPYDVVWRTGANSATKFILTKEMEVGGHKVAAGQYALLTIPSQTEWTVILNKDVDAWGAYTYKETNDVLRFKVKPEALAQPQEYFTIRFDEFTPNQTHVVIEWEDVRIKFLVKQDPDEEIMQQITTAMSGSDIKPGVYIGAANYYYDTNRDLNKALEWAGKALESNKAYWAYAVRAKIAAKLGKCDIAASDAKAGLPEAKKSGDMSYVLLLEKISKDCGK